MKFIKTQAEFEILAVSDVKKFIFLQSAAASFVIFLQFETTKNGIFITSAPQIEFYCLHTAHVIKRVVYSFSTCRSTKNVR